MEPLFCRAVLEKYYVQTYYVHYVHTGAAYSSNNARAPTFVLH